LVIWFTHAAIDRFDAAKYVCWGKEWITSPIEKPQPWSNCNGNGYCKDAPIWLTCWLKIIADNTLHLTINFLALKYL